MGLLDSLVMFVLQTIVINFKVTSFKDIYPKKLEFKVEQQGNHASILDLDIKI